MRQLLYILALLILAAGCGKKVSADVEPHIQAVDLASGSTPEKAAAALVKWLVNADTAQREFSRQLSSGILLYYDTIGSPDSARRFVAAYDSLAVRLSPAKRARLLLAMNRPSKAAFIVAGEGDGAAELVDEIEKLLSNNPTHAQEFASSLEAAMSLFNTIENENRESLRSDD